MDLKILFFIVGYYALASIMFLGISSLGVTTDATYNSTANINPTLTESELDSGGIFAVGVSFVKFIGFVLFGIGLPSDTPASLVLVFIIWQTCITILAIGFIISSIWNG